MSEANLVLVAEAVLRLVGWKPEQSQISPLGGCNAVAFRVNCSGMPAGQEESLFVKLATDCPNPWHRQTEYAKLIGEAGLGPRVIAADESAIVQPLLLGRFLPTWTEWSDMPEEGKHPTAANLGRFIASLHTIPVDPDLEEVPRCFYSWPTVPDWIKGDSRLDAAGKVVLLEVYSHIKERASEAESRGTLGGQRVLMHGDLHVENMLLQDSGQISAVDLELAGPGPRVADLAFFFWHWGWPAKSCGIGGYPSLAVRKQIVSAYLCASGLDATDENLFELLWEIEWEVLLVAMCRVTHCNTPNSVMVPLMHSLLVASTCETSAKNDVVECGVMPAAKAKAVNDGLLPPGFSEHCWETMELH